MIELQVPYSYGEAMKVADKYARVVQAVADRTLPFLAVTLVPRRPSCAQLARSAQLAWGWYDYGCDAPIQDKIVTRPPASRFCR